MASSDLADAGLADACDVDSIEARLAREVFWSTDYSVDGDGLRQSWAEAEARLLL
jgi:hypothetical protein